MVIGICGSKRSGKDTIADILENEYMYNKVSLARPIKDALKCMFGWTEEHVDGAKKDNIDYTYGISPRQVLQSLGTDWAQYNLCEAFPEYKDITNRGLWVKRACQKIIQTDSIFDGTVIPDVRFPHEIEEFKSWFGDAFVLVRVNRKSAENVVDDHESEAYYKYMDAEYDIFNDGSLEDLHDAVDFVMDKINA